jgi:hypothetical protein
MPTVTKKTKYGWTPLMIGEGVRRQNNIHFPENGTRYSRVLGPQTGFVFDRMKKGWRNP